MAQRVQNTGALRSWARSSYPTPYGTTTGARQAACRRLRFILAMMSHPFIALIYGFGFALAVLTIGLVLTAFLAFDAREQVDPDAAALFC